MKKLTLASIITAMLTCPAFADNITSSNKDCDHDNLSTYSGDATLEATWSANTVNITFYSDNTEYDTGTCQYDGTLTLPADDPEKAGYTFSGWTVRRAAAVPVPTYTACSQIQDETTCGQYNQCVWNNGTCYLTYCSYAPSASWCEDALYDEGYSSGCGMNMCDECVWNPHDPC